MTVLKASRLSSNRNVVRRLNAELQADFLPEMFAHLAVWNANLVRIEMHLESLQRQRAFIPLSDLHRDCLIIRSGVDPQG